MPEFRDLPHGPKVLEAKAFDKPRQVRAIIKAGYGAYAAGENGSISVWRDSWGELRADLQRFRVCQGSAVFKSMAECERWIAERLPSINEPNEETRRQTEEMRESLGWLGRVR